MGRGGGRGSHTAHAFAHVHAFNARAETCCALCVCYRWGLPVEDTKEPELTYLPTYLLTYLLTYRWGLPVEDTKEPERTERLLSQPFALCRSRVGDAFQSREVSPLLTYLLTYLRTY